MNSSYVGFVSALGGSGVCLESSAVTLAPNRRVACSGTRDVGRGSDPIVMITTGSDVRARRRDASGRHVRIERRAA